MLIVSDHGFPRGDGSHPDDDPFARFRNERDYIAQSGRMKTTVAAMDWAASEIEELRKRLSAAIEELRKRLSAADPHGYKAAAAENLRKLSQGGAN